MSNHFHFVITVELTDHLTGLLKQNLGGCQFHTNEEVEMAVCEWSWLQKPDFHYDRILHLLQRYVKGSGDMFKNNDA
jgi:hypothetical protein